MSNSELVSTGNNREETKRDSFTKDAIKKSVGGVSMERIDVPNASKELRRYGRELADKSIAVNSDLSSIKTKKAYGSASTSTAPSTGLFCSDLWESISGTIFFDSDVMLYHMNNIYDVDMMTKNMKVCFNNMDTVPSLFALRYLLQQILMMFQAFKIHYSASKVFYKKFYEITLAFGRKNTGLYLSMTSDSAIISLIAQLEELLDGKYKALRVHTLGDDYLQYSLIGASAKNELSQLEVQLTNLMTKIYVTLWKRDINFDDHETFIGLIPIGAYHCVTDLKILLDGTIGFPRVDIDAMVNPSSENPSSPPDVTSAAAPTSADSVISQPSPKNIIRTSSFNVKTKGGGRKAFEIWRYFIIKNYKNVFELLDPANFPKNQFVNSVLGIASSDGDNDDLSREFLYHLTGELQKIVRKYEKMVAAIEVASYPSYTNTIPNLSLRVFWGKYIGDVFEVNLVVFQKALVDYLVLEADYTQPKAKSFAYPVMKAIQYYSTMMTVSVSQSSSLSTTSKKSSSFFSSSSSAAGVPTGPVSLDNTPITAFTVTLFDIITYTESLPPSETDTLVKFFKAFVKMHLNVTVAIYPNQDHLGVMNPYVCFPEKEFKKAVYNLKSRKGWVNIPAGTPPRSSGRTTTILYLLNKIKHETNTCYLDFHHASSEASCIAYILSQLHMKYTAGSSSMGMIPLTNDVTHHAATRHITKQLFFEYFGLFLEKLNKDVIIVFDNIEPTGCNIPSASSSSSKPSSPSSSPIISLSKSSSSSTLSPKRPSFTRSLSISSSSSGLNSNHVISFIHELINFIQHHPTYLRRFTFVMVGGMPGMLASAEAEGTCKTMDLPTYNNEQLKTVAAEVYPVDYRVVYDLSNGNIGHMATLADTISLDNLRAINDIFQRKLSSSSLSSSSSSTSSFAFSPEVDMILKHSVFQRIISSLAGYDDELLVMSCILPNIGVFHYSYAWYVCKPHFDGNLFKFHSAFMKCNRAGYYDYIGSNYYIISKYYQYDTSFQYRNYFSATGELTPGAPVNPSAEAILYPLNTSIVLQYQWDLYYEYWSKELARMNDIATVSPQVLDYFPIIYPHFRSVFGNFGLYPRITLYNPLNPHKKMMVYIDAYDKFKNKANVAVKSANNDQSNVTAPAASSDAPAIVDTSKLKSSKLGEVSMMLAGAVGKVLTRYYPTVAGQLISASIIEGIDIEAVARTIHYGALPPAPGIESTIIAGDDIDFDDDDDNTVYTSNVASTTSSPMASRPAVHPLEEKYYGAICDFVEQLLRPDSDTPSSTAPASSYISQANSIMTFYFNMKAMMSVKPAMIWIRGLMLSGNLKTIMKTPAKAKAYYQRAYDMIIELESSSSSCASSANDILEPLGRYKHDVCKLLNITFTPSSSSSGDDDIINTSSSSSKPELKKKNSMKRQASLNGSSSSSASSLKRSQSLRSDKSDDAASSSTKKEKCVVM